MGDVSPIPHQLLVEAMVFGDLETARCISNRGVRHLQADDYIMTLTFLVYTTMLVLIRVSAEYATNLLPPSEQAAIFANPKNVRARIYGSMIVIGSEQCMLISTWGVKTCLVTMYWKLTHLLPWHIFVQILAGYVALGFAVIEITYFAVYSRPFSQYWAVPVENAQCATYQHYSITQAVFNISSDAFMLAIPVPLLKGTQMPIRKKILLISVLGLGVFVMIAAILNKYFNFQSPDTTIYQLWYIREASTAIYVANLMCWWPLLRKVFGSALSHYNSRYQSNRYGEQLSGQVSHPLPFRSSAAGASATHSVVQKDSKSKRWWSQRAESKALATTASQEAINNTEEMPLEIWRKVEYNVEQNSDSKPVP
ncbi:uncharacterized protein BDW70DRAFT_159966 [Aspergillus foveolatus]|uniref:uncharacterized protein n=1 Tax=Aspergillus foveolatus TaxID=210207 RepID=UPI003CCE4083